MEPVREQGVMRCAGRVVVVVVYSVIWRRPARCVSYRAGRAFGLINLLIPLTDSSYSYYIVYYRRGGLAVRFNKLLYIQQRARVLQSRGRSRFSVETHRVIYNSVGVGVDAYQPSVIAA